MFDELGHLFVEEEVFATELDHASFREHLRRSPVPVAAADAVLFGVPFDGGSVRHYGSNEGPLGIRRAFAEFRTYSAELDRDFRDSLAVADLGNVAVPNGRDYDPVFGAIRKTVGALVEAGKFIVMLGGDHSISFPAVGAFAQQHARPVGLIWIDNHFDTMSPLHGDPFYCGCPLRNIMRTHGDLVRPENVVHIGSRGYGNSAANARNAKELGFSIVGVAEVERRGAAEVMHEAVAVASDGTATFWVSVDIDAADVVYAPGTQCPRPGGLTSRELTTLVREAALAGAGGFDVVEVAPPLDRDNATCLLAAECVLEALGAHAYGRTREAVDLGLVAAPS